GKYSAAAEAYTEAITLEPSDAALYQNRALCYQKLCKWNQVLDDARKALELSKKSVKAQYLLATAFMNLNQARQDERGEGGKREKGGREEMRQGRLVYNVAQVVKMEERAKRIEEGRWEGRRERDEQEEFSIPDAACSWRKQRKHFKMPLYLLHSRSFQVACAVMGDCSDIEFERRRAQLNEIYERVSEKRQESTIPESLCCQITFDLMRDPVLTPAGQTYESAALEQHLKHNGHWDPVTRQPINPSQVVKNLAVK
ncbi:hypothetical protein GUITHDRAFT_61061, partial [Guillardia theta CCMP2712]